MAKRIGVMTFLHNDNYGSTLQAWALQHVLRSMGLEAEHIDYAPSSREKLVNLLRSGNSLRLVLEGLRKRAVKAGNEGARHKSAAFPDFYRAHMRLSPVCRDQAALKKQAAAYDLLLCGSDQIWSPVWLNPAYFLNFAADKPRVAYAPSLGVSAIDSKRKARRMAGLLKPFRAISCREQEGAAALAALTGRACPVLPDPVCLPDREAWQALAEAVPGAEGCIVCYFIGANASYWQRVEELHARTGLPVRVIPVTEEAYQQPWPLLDGLSPAQWLGCLMNAAHVVTDSFHGTVFATLLQRPFTVLRRYRDDDPESKNSRIDQLLRTLELSGGEDVPWDAVARRLDDLRRQGLAWLQQAVTEAP